MLFLSNEGVEIKEGKFEIKMNVITKPMQASYIAIAADNSLSEFKRHIKMIDFVLSRCIEELVVDGEELDPVYVATHANIMDEDTLSDLRTIHELCSPHIEGLGKEERKK